MMLTDIHGVIAGPDTPPTNHQPGAQVTERAMKVRAIHDVIAERQRQCQVEGWTPWHDDNEHNNGELARAATCYADTGNHLTQEQFDAIWPWGRSAWKPKDARRDLVRAAALLIAEIERLDRAEGTFFVAHPSTTSDTGGVAETFASWWKREGQFTKIKDTEPADFAFEKAIAKAAWKAALSQSAAGQSVAAEGIP